ncbi:hypothetical protein K8I61_08950 [bacterium]|nr:hypothetical protein [bacterium]
MRRFPRAIYFLIAASAIAMSPFAASCSCSGDDDDDSDTGDLPTVDDDAADDDDTAGGDDDDAGDDDDSAGDDDAGDDDDDDDSGDDDDDDDTGDDDDDLDDDTGDDDTGDDDTGDDDTGDDDTGDDDSAVAYDHLVTIDGSDVDIDPLNIDVGDTVRFLNEDSLTHRLMSGTPGNPDGEFDTGNLGNGDFFDHTFDSVDSYTYYCSLHSGTMFGYVINVSAVK